jgi:hypothetical protein
MTLPGEAPIMNLIHTGSGSNKLRDLVMELTVYFSAEDAQYAIQPYDNIGILPFRRFISSEAFLRVIYPSESVVHKYGKAVFRDRPTLPGVGYIVYRGHLFNSV